ncbi:MAG: hypothetical protein M3Q71_19475 [Chloroflexota bacterium]|nr:hypothetical protein [Chloroflexota bacterium]
MDRLKQLRANIPEPDDTSLRVLRTSILAAFAGPVAGPSKVHSVEYNQPLVDGGTLNRGLVHASTLNVANDRRTCITSFETLVRRGEEVFGTTQALTPSGVARAAS